MRIHINTPNVMTHNDIIDALDRCIERGTIAGTVQFKVLRRCRSNTALVAFEIQLESIAKIPGDGRRAGNSGSYGSMQDGTFAATYDEWGFLLHELYELDPDMIVGSPKYPTYRSAADFDHQTGLSYNPARLLRAIEKLTGDPYAHVTRKPVAGRLGWGRLDSFDSPEHELRHAIINERTPAWVCEFTKHTDVKAGA